MFQGTLLPSASSLQDQGQLALLQCPKLPYLIGPICRTLEGWKLQRKLMRVCLRNRHYSGKSKLSVLCLKQPTTEGFTFTFLPCLGSLFVEHQPLISPVRKLTLLRPTHPYHAMSTSSAEQGFNHLPFRPARQGANKRSCGLLVNKQGCPAL